MPNELGGFLERAAGRAHPGATVVITYDARLGFPTRIEVTDPQVSDACGALIASDFEALE